MATGKGRTTCSREGTYRDIVANTPDVAVLVLSDKAQVSSIFGSEQRELACPFLHGASMKLEHS
eukprot:768125-Hanusia_phi.AAC.2